jgi:hypothetical protein
MKVKRGEDKCSEINYTCFLCNFMCLQSFFLDGRQFFGTEMCVIVCFEVIMVMSTKIAVFWDVMLSSLIGKCQCFRGPTQCLG